MRESARKICLLATALLLPACGSNNASPPAPPGPPPGNFTQTFPINNAADQPTRPTLDWTAAADAVSYRVEIASDPGFSTIVLDTPGVTDLFTTIGSDLARSTDHWWRVTAVNPGGQTVAGNAALKFRTIPPPPASFTLLGPEDGQSFVVSPVTFEWTSSAGSVRYLIDVSRQPDFSTLDLNVQTTNLKVTASFLPNTLYYWRVRAVNAGGETSSEVRTFTTENVHGSLVSRIGTLIALAYDSFRNRVYLSNNTNGTIERYDVTSGTFLAPVVVGNDPHGLDLTPDGSRLLVCLRIPGTVAVLDLSTDPPLIERTITLPPSFTNETILPSAVATLSNGLAFVAFFNSTSPLREINLSSWAVTTRSECRPYTGTIGSPFGLTPSRTVLVVSESGLSGGDWWDYETATNVFTNHDFDVGTSYFSALNAAGTLIAFSDQFLSRTNVLQALIPQTDNLLFHPDGLRFLRIVKDRAFVGIGSLTTYLDLELLPLAAQLQGPAVMNPAGTRFFAIAAGGLIDLPLPQNRPPVIEPIPRMVVTSGTSVGAKVQARDPDGDPVSLSVGTLPANATFNSATGLLQFSPAVGQQGQNFIVWVRATAGGQTRMARVDLEVPSPGGPTLRLIPIAGVLKELSFDSVRNRLYIANEDHNRIETVDLATASLMSPIPVGPGPDGIDLNATKSTLVLCPFRSGYIETVDLTATPPALGWHREVPLEPTYFLRRPEDVAVAANGKALFASSYGGTALTPVWEMTLSTGTVTRRLDIPNVNSTIWEPGSFSATGDRTKIIIGTGAVSSGSVYRYVSSTDSFLSKVDTGVFYRDLATNLDGSRICTSIPGGIVQSAQIYDGSVGYLGQLTEATYMTAFSPDSSKIYWVPQGKAELVTTETTAYAELGRVTLPAAVKGRMALNASGDRLFLVVDGGLLIINVVP